MIRLTLTSSDGIKATFVLEGSDDVFLGRVPAINDVCVQDPSISRKHAQIKFREEGPTIYDLKSRNGTFLNGARVARAVLHDGDEVRLGTIPLEVSFLSGDEEKLIEIEGSDVTSAGFKEADDEVTGKFDLDDESD